MTPGEHTKPRQFRAPTAIWEAYGRLCERRGTTRAAALNEHMRAELEKHGTKEERAAIAVADAELEERRARVGGRPPKA